jgi:hypothetical protein
MSRHITLYESLARQQEELEKQKERIREETGLQGLSSPLGSEEYHEAVRKILEFKQQVPQGTDSLSNLVDGAIVKEVNRTFREHKDWEAFHALLITNIQFFNTPYERSFSKEFKVFPGPRYYFNCPYFDHFWDEYLNWVLGVKDSSGRDIKNPRLRMLAPGRFKQNNGILELEVRDVARAIAIYKKGNFRMFLPEVEIRGLPFFSEPITTSLGIMEGYWERDDMNDDYNRYEIMLSKHEISEGVSTKTKNHNDNDI